MSSSATTTTRHLDLYRDLIQKWSISQAERPPTAISDASLEIKDKDVVVVFRTRPSLEGEAQSKFTANSIGEDAPIEFCSGISIDENKPGFVAHVPGQKWSGPTLTHKTYDSDIVIGPLVDNGEVYRRTVADVNLLPLVLSGGIGCILAYGQTGSGKTYSMEAIEHRIAGNLFSVAAEVGQKLLLAENSASGTAAEDVFEFNVTFLELLGKHASDLVEPNVTLDEDGEPIRKSVPISEDKVGDVRPMLIETTVKSSDELEALIVESLAHRRTSPTLRNTKSSRSHAMLTITVKNTLLPYAIPGKLILVDLAGSERYEDSKAHDKKRMAESKENNGSLMNLKECVRAKAKMANEDGFVHIPWRSNKLTMLLKPIFDIESRQPSKLIVIAHVSPHIQDTVHSVNTLSYASPFKTSPVKPRGPVKYNPKDPRTWNHDQTHAYLVSELTKIANHGRRGDHELKSKAALLKGKKLKPLAEQPVSLMLNVDKLCPPGMTALVYAKMYTVEFVEECLKAAAPAEGEKPLTKVRTDAVKDAGSTIIANIFYLTITAKGKSRSEVMKSRKHLTAGDIYGDPPEGAAIEHDAKDLVAAQAFIGEEAWYGAITVACTGFAEGTDSHIEARQKTIDGMMVTWRRKQASIEA